MVSLDRSLCIGGLITGPTVSVVSLDRSLCIGGLVKQVPLSVVSLTGYSVSVVSLDRLLCSVFLVLCAKSMVYRHQQDAHIALRNEDCSGRGGGAPRVALCRVLRAAVALGTSGRWSTSFLKIRRSSSFSL